MVNDSAYKAAKVANLIQTAAKLLVLLVIVPTAALLAIFYITEPFIEDPFVRQLISLAVSFVLAGRIAAKVDHDILGYCLVLGGTVVGAFSFSSLWNQLYVIIGCLHGALVVALLVVFDASSRDTIKNTLTSATKVVLTLLVVITGPLIGAAYAIGIGLSIAQTATAGLLVSVPYLFILHIHSKDPRVGILSISVISAAASLIFGPLIYSGIQDASLIEVFPSHFIVMGLALLISSQTFRYMQHRLLTLSFRSQVAAATEELTIDFVTIAENTEDEEGPPSQESAKAYTYWIIDPHLAHYCSSVGLIMVSCGLPVPLLAIASLSFSGSADWFMPLFAPLAGIASLLTAIPSVVFLRLSRRITRGLEERTTKLLGSLIVLLGTIASYTWSQFSVWTVEYSLLLSAVIALTGMTGIFKEMRRLWKQLWMSLVRRFRIMKLWIFAHPVQAGIAIDALTTITIVSMAIPFLRNYAYYEHAILPLSASIASTIGMLGLAAIKRVRNRMLLLAKAFVIVLFSNVPLTFWYLHIVLANEALQSISIALFWMLGSAVLQKVSITRRMAGLLYTPGAFGVLLYLTQIQLPQLSMQYSLTVLAAIILPAAIAHKEYKQALARMRTEVYHALGLLKAVLLKFILISYGVFIASLSVAVGYFAFFILYFEIHSVLVISGFLFFLSYLPGVKRHGMHIQTLVVFIISSLSFLAGSLTYLLALGVLPQIQSLCIGGTSSIGILFLSRGDLSEGLNRHIPAALWCSALISIALTTYWWQSSINEQYVAMSWTAAILSICLLVSTWSEQLKPIAGIGYGISASATCVLLWHVLRFPLIYLFSSILLFLIPVAYPYYLRALTYLKGLAITIGMSLLILIMTYTTAVALLAGFSLSVLIILYIPEFFDALFQPALGRWLFFGLLTLLFTVPTIKEDRYNAWLRIGLLVTTCLLAAMFIVLLIQPIGPLISLLLGGLTLSITLRVALNGMPKKILVVNQDIIAMMMGLIIYYQLFIMGSLIFVFLISTLPFFLLAVIHSQSEPYGEVHRSTAAALIVFYATLFWTIFYPVVEVAPLCLVSGFTSISILRAINSEESVHSYLIASASVVVLLETLWIWHSYYIYALGFKTIITGSTLLLCSSLLIPITKGMKWTRFELIWEVVSGLNALMLAANLSEWDPLGFSMPARPLLTIGWILSFYALFSTPAVYCAEEKIPGISRIAHIHWSPSILGWLLVTWEFSIFLNDYHLRLGLSLIGVSCAIAAYLALYPNKTNRLLLMINACFASSFAYVAWSLVGGFDNQLAGIGASAVIWYLVGLPITLPATRWTIKRLKEFGIKYKIELAYVFPLILSLATVVAISTTPAWMILGMQVGHLVVAVAAGSFVSCFMYFVAAQLIDEKHHSRVLILSCAGASISVFSTSMLFLLPESVYDVNSSLFAFSSSIAMTLFVGALLGRSFHLKRLIHPTHALGGAFAGFAAFIGASSLIGWPLLDSILLGVFVTLVVEAPLISSQIRAFVRILTNLGALMVEALRRLNEYLRYVFDRFGYSLWVIFSILLTAIIGTLSYPFFSELIGMQVACPLYIVPSYAIPLGLFGLLSVSIAAIRRKIQSPFGMSGVGIFISGTALTAGSVLISRGLLIPAISGIWAMSFIFLTILAEHLNKEESVVQKLFSSIPMSLSILVASLLSQPTMSMNHLAIIFGISSIVFLGIFIGAIKIGLASRKMLKPLEIGISLVSALITYAAAELVFLPLTSIYLAAFVMSWLLLPIARREHIHLFNAPLFFALTGFGFAFVFGEIMHGLFLAIATLLLFISLHIRELEEKSPRLVYARLATLFLLIVCLTGFAYLAFLL